MKKLLYITTNLQDSGGVSRILSVKLNYLIETYNYDISVINSNQNGDSFFYDFNSKIKFYFLKTKQLFNYKKDLNILVNKVKPDIIINCDNGLKGSLLTYLIGSKIPLIYERHCGKNINVSSFKEQFKLKLSNLFLQMSINKYNRFIVLNSVEKNDWKGQNIQIIPNPLWFNIPKDINKKVNKITIAVGRHSYEKRYDKLISIWKHVVLEHPNWILKIYGAKNVDISLEKIVIEEKLEKNIKFYDPISDVEKIYSEASMLLTTSESESFGLVLIEAMAFGIPVIAFDGTSGAQTIIQNEENGFLIKNNDIKSYVQKINLLVGNSSLRNLMGENARNSVKTYGLNSIMKEWHELFS